MFLAIILSVVVIFIHLNEDKMDMSGEITTRNNRLHRFIEINMDNYKELLEENWVLCINCEVNPYNDMSFYELLYITNIATLSIDSINTAMIFDMFNLSRTDSLYYIWNGVVLDQNGEIVSIINLNKKKSIANIIDVYLLSKVRSLHKYVRLFASKLRKYSH